jgi:hypothetical protein
MIGLTVPATDAQSSEYVFNLVTGFSFGTITKEIFHCTAFTNIFLQSVNKIFVGLYSVHIRNQRFTANEDLRSSNNAFNSRVVAEYSIGSNGFIALLNISGRELRFPMLFQSIRNTAVGKLRGDIKRSFDSIHRGPTRKRTEQVKVGF